MKLSDSLLQLLTVWYEKGDLPQEIYRQGLAYADSIELTRVHADFEADTFFPEINKNEWTETQSKIHAQDENHKYTFSFLTYERR